METKVCNRCFKEKEIILFRKRKDSKDGRRTLQTMSLHKSPTIMGGGKPKEE